MRMLSTLLLVAALGLGAIAAYQFAFEGDRPGLVFEKTDYRVDGTETIGTAQTVSFRAVNRSGRPIRVVGLSSC